MQGTFWRSKNSLGCPVKGWLVRRRLWLGPTALPKLGGRRGSGDGVGERQCGGPWGGRMWGHDPQIVKSRLGDSSLN